MSFAWAKPYEPKTELGRWMDERYRISREMSSDDELQD